ncbi:MAG: hypothetical protein IIZ61_09850 [Lachnospiraceae bacterium]|nr:hypothetical protein [Lachnospiraceae bacterium]
MLTKDDILSLNYYRTGAEFTGSIGILRYKISPVFDEEKKPVSLAVYTWEGLYAFPETPSEEIEQRDFPFSDEGRESVVEYINSLS